MHSWGPKLLGFRQGQGLTHLHALSSTWSSVGVKYLLKRREGIRMQLGQSVPWGVGVEEKGNRQEPAQGTVSGSAWTPFLRPIYLGSPPPPLNHQGWQETRAGWSWPHCLVGDPNPILARPRRYFKLQLQAAASYRLAHLWLQSHCPPPGHFLLPTLGPPGLVLGSMCLGETLLSVGPGLSTGTSALLHPIAEPS